MPRSPKQDAGLKGPIRVFYQGRCGPHLMLAISGLQEALILRLSIKCRLSELGVLVFCLAPILLRTLSRWRCALNDNYASIALRNFIERKSDFIGEFLAHDQQPSRTLM